MHTETEIYKIVPMWTSLTSAKNGFATQTLNNNGFDYGFLPDAELERLDPRLPAALRIYQNEGHKVFGISVLQILKLWETNTFVETTNGERYGISDVSHILFSRVAIHIQGDGSLYKVRQHPDTGENLFIPTRPAPQRASVSRAWLDQNHAGWLERYEIASDLGMSKYEAFKAMVSLPSNEVCLEVPSDIGF